MRHLEATIETEGSNLVIRAKAIGSMEQVLDDSHACLLTRKWPS